MTTVIRKEKPEDQDAVRTVNLTAFGQSEEADIVDHLRRDCDDLLSLVAVADRQVVDHILFSPAQIDHGSTAVGGMGLAPMAVLPDYQNQGIGGLLVRAGIERLIRLACPFIIVLGHPTYYPKFGFQAASRHGLQCQWDAPDEAFMALVLGARKLKGVKGVARYRAEFDVAM